MVHEISDKKHWRIVEGLDRIIHIVEGYGVRMIDSCGEFSTEWKVFETLAEARRYAHLEETIAANQEEEWAKPHLHWAAPTGF